MLDIKANGGGGETSEDSQGEADPPGGGDEDEQDVEEGGGAEKDGSLDVHLGTVAAFFAGAEEEFVNAATKFSLKIIGADEFDAARCGDTLSLRDRGQPERIFCHAGIPRWFLDEAFPTSPPDPKFNPQLVLSTDTLNNVAQLYQGFRPNSNRKYRLSN
jgi:hypothetical protein